MQRESKRPDISVVIIAKNAVHTLQYCLSSAVKISDDVVLMLDYESNDGSASLAESFGVRIERTVWLGYGPTKNKGNELAKCDWILSLDADEYLDDQSIANLNQLSPQNNNVYLINRLTYVGEVPIKYSGWHPDWNVRLFNKKTVRWDEKPVHESLLLNSNIKKIKVKGMMHHLSVRSFDELETRLDRYARLRAEEWLVNPKKLSFFYRFTRPAFRFFRNFVIKLGFLDGAYGWKIAQAEYTMIKKQYEYFDLYKKKEISHRL